MGQTTSNGDHQAGGGGLVPVLLSNLQGDIQRHAATFRELTTLSYPQFLADIKELNKKLGSDLFIDASGKRLVFNIKKGSDSSVLWRGTVRIGCAKVDSETGKIESHRLLNLRQFLQVKKTILCQTTDQSETVDLSASVIIDKMDNMSCEGGELDECCICMERKPEVILPCAHNYCLPCIEQWNFSNKTCPICRAALETTDESWVISEKPDSAEMAAEVRKCLIGLADERE